MLTRELLLSTKRNGRVRPRFVRADDAGLLELAGTLVAEAEAHVGLSRDALEDALATHAGAFARPPVARGLVKLVLDRCEFEAAAEGVTERRLAVFRAAAGVLRGLPSGASVAEYEGALASALGGSELPSGGPHPVPLPAGEGLLARVRDSLYSDLPSNLPLRSFESLPPRALLERYNLALAQGLLLEARRVTLRVRAPELLRVRKVLRWLRFCRLVAEVRREGEDWTLEVEGPGAVLELSRRYGLQLASFLSAVPVLERWTLSARLHPRRGGEATLELSDADGLVSPLGPSLGHVPEEVAALTASFDAAGWQVDDVPVPRPVGATGVCVPDLVLTRREGRASFALELFHAWHAGPLLRRLEELRQRSDPGLVLGVERALVRAHPEVAAHPAVFLFHQFPSPRKLAAWLEARVAERANAAQGS